MVDEISQKNTIFNFLIFSKGLIQIALKLAFKTKVLIFLKKTNDIIITWAILNEMIKN